MEKVAINALKKGYSIESISDIAGLAIDEVKNWTGIYGI